MATIEQVQQQIQQAKIISAQKKAEAEKIERELSQRQEKLRKKISSATALRKTSLLARKRLASFQRQIGQQISSVQQYREQTIPAYEKEIAGVEQEIQRQSSMPSQPSISQKQIQQFIMYPWGKEFSQLPKNLQQKFEQMHQDYIGGAEERKQALAKGLSQSDILKGVYSLQSSGAGISPTTSILNPKVSQIQQGVNVPAGYSSEEMWKVFEKYNRQIPESEKKGLSNIEKFQLVTENPQYKAEIKALLSTPEQTEKLQQYAVIRGYKEPEQYGAVSYIPQTSYTQLDTGISSTPQLQQSSLLNPSTITEPPRQSLYQRQYNISRNLMDSPRQQQSKWTYNYKTRRYERTSVSGGRSTIETSKTITPEIAQDVYETSYEEFPREEVVVGGNVLRVPNVSRFGSYPSKVEEVFEKGVLYPVGTAGQMWGGIFTTPITETEKQQLTGLGFFNPVRQYQVYSSYQEYKKSIGEGMSVSNKLGRLNEDYKKTEEDYNKGKITYEEYLKKYNEYALKFDYYSKDKAYQTLLQDRTTTYQDIARTKFTPLQKGILSGVVGFTDIGTYMLPQTRFIRGAGQVSEGISGLGYAVTPEQKLGEAGNIFFGGLITGSAFAKGGGLFSKAISGKFGTAGRVVSKAGRIILPTGIMGLYGASQYQQTDSLPVAVGSAVGGLTAFAVPNYNTIRNQLQKLSTDKGGYYRQQQELAPSEEYIYDYNEGVWKKVNKLTGKVTRLQATTEFGRLSEESQIKILRRAFTTAKDEAGNSIQRVYLDKKSLLKDIEKSKAFMREAGLTNVQINRLINKLFPNIEVEVPVVKSAGGVQEQITPQKVSPITQSVLEREAVKSKFSGLKLGEGMPSLTQQPKQEFKDLTAQTDKSAFNLFFKNLARQKVTQQTKQQQRQGFANVLSFKQMPRLAQAQKQLQLQRQGYTQQQRYLQQTRQTQRQKQELVNILGKARQQIKRTEKGKPRAKPPVKPPVFDLFGGKKVPIKKTEDFAGGFDIFIKSKGKFVQTGFEENVFSAFKKLKGGLLSGLQASGFVVEKRTGRKVPVAGFEDVLFRKGKRSPTLLVQRKGGLSPFGRLTTEAERQQIKRARKKSSKKKKAQINWLGNNKKKRRLEWW